MAGTMDQSSRDKFESNLHHMMGAGFKLYVVWVRESCACKKFRFWCRNLYISKFLRGFHSIVNLRGCYCYFKCMEIVFVIIIIIIIIMDQVVEKGSAITLQGLVV